MEAVEDEKRVLAQFKSEDGVLVGTPFDLPLGVTKDSLAALCNAVLETVSRSNACPYRKANVRARSSFVAYSQDLLESIH